MHAVTDKYVVSGNIFIISATEIQVTDSTGGVSQEIHFFGSGSSNAVMSFGGSADGRARNNFFNYIIRIIFNASSGMHIKTDGATSPARISIQPQEELLDLYVCPPELLEHGKRLKLFHHNRIN